MSALDRLRTIAETATPGPWEHAGQGLVKQLPDPDDGLGYGIAEVMTPKDASFIEAFDPSLVLALLDVAEAAERVVRSPYVRDAEGRTVQALDDVLARLREETP